MSQPSTRSFALRGAALAIGNVTAAVQVMSPAATDSALTALGYYVALCLNVDAESRAPHTMLGMVDVFTVGEPGRPAA